MKYSFTLLGRVAVPVLVLIFCGVFISALLGTSLYTYFFPMVILSALTPLCLYVLVSTVTSYVRLHVNARSAPTPQSEAPATGLAARSDWTKTGMVAVGLVAFWLLMNYAGFVVAALIFGFFVPYALGVRPYWKALVFSGLLTIAAWIFATHVLQLSLPSGVLARPFIS